MAKNSAPNLLPTCVLSCVQASTVSPRFSLTYTLQRSHCASAVLAQPSMNQLSHPWHRPDPSTTFRRYLAAVRPQGQLLAVHHHHASPERMVHHDDFYSMTHQSKKKRIEDDPLPTDAGAKPIQLQRRRVWRACESCRQVDRALHSHIYSPTRTNRADRRRKKIKCDGCEPTCSQCQSSGSQCTWLQTKDRAALSRQ